MALSELRAERALDVYGRSAKDRVLVSAGNLCRGIAVRACIFPTNSNAVPNHPAQEAPRQRPSVKPSIEPLVPNLQLVLSTNTFTLGICQKADRVKSCEIGK